MGKTTFFIVNILYIFVTSFIITNVEKYSTLKQVFVVKNSTKTCMYLIIRIKNIMVRDRIQAFIDYNGLSIREFERLCNFPNGTINSIRDNISTKRKIVIAEKFPTLNIVWLLTGEGPMIKQTDAETQIIRPVNSTKEALDSLNKLRKTKGRPNRSRIIHDSELVEAEQFIIPIPGQAGLKKAFFAPDQYIEDHFEKETILVRPNERAIYHKIEVDGDSMPGIVDQGDWARCVDIPKTEWLEKGTFKPNRVYCLFHRYKGPLFKRITKTFLDSITLSSDNADKDEYPDEVFDLAEFSKILRVVVVEKRL